MNNLKRIAWLDSCNMPSRIHLTSDDALSTLCGHFPKEKQLAGHYWKITSEVPRKIKGTSRYCKICFKNGGKSLEWFK